MAATEPLHADLAALLDELGLPSDAGAVAHARAFRRDVCRAAELAPGDVWRQRDLVVRALPLPLALAIPTSRNLSRLSSLRARFVAEALPI